MENHNSSEKLVAVEAGLTPLKKPKNFSFFTLPRRTETLNKYTNYLFILLAITLIVTISYGTWQAVRSEKLMKEIEDQKSLNLKQQLPSEDSRIQYMADDIIRVRNTLMEVLELIEQQNLTPESTESPIKTSTQPIIDETTQDLESDWLTSLPDETTSERTEPSIPEITVPAYFPSAEISDEDHSSVPVKDIEQIGDTKSGFHWTFSFDLGGKSSEHDTYEGLNAAESKELDAITSTEMDIVTTEGAWSDYIPGILASFGKPFEITWGWYSSNEEDGESTENGEEVEEQINSMEIETVSSTVSTPVVPTADNDSDTYYGFYDSDESYEYSYDTQYESGDTDEVVSSSTEDTLNDTSIVNANTESSSPSAVSENMEGVYESVTTNATVSSISSPQSYKFSFDSEPGGQEDIYGLGSLGDILNQSLGLGYTPNDENTEEELPATGETLEELSEPSLSRDRENIEKYFKDLLAKRLADVKFWEQQLTANGEVGEYVDMLKGDYDDDYVDAFAPSTFTNDDWSYISKRSVDTPSALERRGDHLTAKELAQKMIILQQEIDDDNHLLQNVVSLTAEPAKDVLQKKLNNFYEKMEAVSAHIDRLHDRFMRLNKLDDDYVSREFPSEDVDASWTPVN